MTSSPIRSVAIILVLAIPYEGLASPARTRIAILPSIVSSGPGAIAPMALATALERALLLRPDLEPFTPVELIAGTALCGTDLACIGERARAGGVQLVLRTIVNHSVDPPLISLHLVDATSGAIVREAFDEAGPDVAASATMLARQLFDEAGYREVAAVQIELSPPDAQVSFEAARKIGPQLYLVEPGRHRVEASRKGYLPASQEVAADRGRETRVVVELIEEPSSIAASPWLWVGIGAGVAAIAVVAILVVVDPFRPDDGCLGFPGGPCP